MSGMFCRHNRLTTKCAICSREIEEQIRSKSPVRHVQVRKPGATSTPRSKATTTNPKRVVTRQLQRAADDGYRNPLVPGLKATADAERLAGALSQAEIRLHPPGPYPIIAEEPDLEQAAWLAFLLALAPELQELIEETRPRWEDAELDALPEAKARTATAYRAWVARAGSQEEAFTGEA